MGSLRRAPARLDDLVRAATRGRLARRPKRGEWSAAETLCHLADAEVALAFRLRKIAAEPGRELPAWDQERWAVGGRYTRTPVREALGLFTAVRRANLAYVARLNPRQREQHGRHPAYGRLTISQVLAHWAEHDRTHLAQMRSVLAQSSRAR